MPNYTHLLLSQSFLRGIAFSKNVTDFDLSNVWTMNISNYKDVLLAVKKAYIDLQPRTYKKIKSWWDNPINVKKDGSRQKSIQTSWENDKENVLEKLATDIFKYITTYTSAPIKPFDDWHNEECNDFLSTFNPVLNKYGYKSIEYGKAQKIVNMTFKYLFCFDDAMSYLSVFNQCHMPIDSYILKWYEKEVIKSKSNISSWSDMDEKQYLDLQTNIKTHIFQKPQPEGPNQFLSEFYIWDRYK
jgi:hypothetical protein